ALASRGSPITQSAAANTAPIGWQRTFIRREKKGRGIIPVQIRCLTTVREASGADLTAPPHDLVLQPGRGNDEQGCQDEPEQRVEPDQGDVKAAKGEANPDRAQRAVCLHVRSSR